MRAEFIEQPNFSAGIAEGNEVFPQQPHPYRRAVGLGNFVGQDGGNPIHPHSAAHGGAWPNAGDDLVVFT